MVKVKGDIIKMSQKLSEEYVLQEIIKCKRDPIYFMANYIYVPVEGTSDYTLLKLFDAQKPYVQSLASLDNDEIDKSGVIFLASRQCGKTKITEAYIVWLLVFHNNYPVLFMTREKSPLGTKMMKQISDMIKMLPDWLHPPIIIDNATNIKLANNSEVILQASKKQTNVSQSSTQGRGFTPLFIWIDEAAFLPLDEHMEALVGATSFSFQTARRKRIPFGFAITSTPNGKDGIGSGFYRLWQSANIDPESPFIPIRLHWSEIPVYDEKWFKRQTRMLNERRINQEYELVFLGSNESIFSDSVIKLLTDKRYAREPIKHEKLKDINGEIEWFDIPSPDKRYIIGIDTATSFGSDLSAITVVDYETDSDIAVVIAKCSIDRFKMFVKKFVENFKNYVLAIERNSVGTTVVEYLYSIPEIRRHVIMDCKRDKYGNFMKTNKPGINSNLTVRNLILDKLNDVVENNTDALNSYKLRFQLSTLTNRKGRIEGADHDDIVFSYGIALFSKYYYYANSYFKMSQTDDIFDTVYGNQSENEVETSLEFLERMGIDTEQIRQMKSMLNKDDEPDILIIGD